MGRRSFLVGGVAAAVAGLAGCASGTGRDESGPTRTINSHMGPVQIPAQPQRVVCLDQYATLAMLDVGLRPAGTIEGLEEWIPHEQRATYQQLPKVGSYQADPERILALNPDLIIGNSAFTLSDAGTYDKLNDIAATVILTSVVSGQWEQMAAQVADAVNRGPRMDELRKRYEARADEIRQRHGDRLARTRISLVAAFQTGRWNLCLPDSWSGVVLDRAGCQFAAASRGRTGSAVEQSFEQLGTLADSDLLFHQVNPDGQVSTPMRTLVEQANFRALPAVRGGNAVPLRNLYVFSYAQALGALDELDAALGRLH